MGNKAVIERLVFISILIALSVVMGIIDFQLSAVLQPIALGSRIGLANIIVLTGIYFLRFEDTLMLVILKSLVTGLMLGSFMTFVIGLTGTLLSFFTMTVLLKFTKDKISLIGVSIAGGITHNIGQVIALYFFGYGWSVVFTLFYLIPIGIGSGIFIGSTATVLISYLKKGTVFKTITESNNSQDVIERLIGDIDE